MCGILGWLGNHAYDDISRFGRALDSLAHRGPDDRGVWQDDGILLGHRRLSIVDLSMAGHQPMIDDNTGAVIIFNGEIYNYIEIKNKLIGLGYKIKGNSDTEVLLYALIEWGLDAIAKLNGMWAFAFWSPRTRKLILSRDRFGVKPLYYCINDEGFSFASEPKALLSLFEQNRKIDRHTLIDFLAYNRLYAKDNSFYENIKIFPSAHCAIYDVTSGSLKFEKYWDYPKHVDTNLSENDALAQFSALLDDAVRLRMRSDVPVGLTLSGGLDSTSILASIKNNSLGALNCFTSVYQNQKKDERAWAEIACKNSNAALRFVSAPEEDWLKTLRTIVWQMDGPGYSPAVYPLWHLMKQARSEGIYVLLEGQGADEALGGYPQYAILEMLEYISGNVGEINIRGFFNRIRSLSNTFTLRWSIAWALRELFPVLLKLHRQRIGFQSLQNKDFNLPDDEPFEFPIRDDKVNLRLFMDHSKDILPGLLHYGDAISMAHGVESRNPFLDYRLVEWMFRLPLSLRFNNNETKWVLREYLRNNGQQRIGSRHDKKGYPTPIAEWMAIFDNELVNLLCKKESLLHEWCDPSKIRNLIIQNKQGQVSSSHYLYKILTAQLWIEECIQNEGSE